MTETKYLKIISNLFRLTGYATGILKGVTWVEADISTAADIAAAIRYLEEQQNSISLQLDEENK
jgi:hypothetical protein